MKPSVNPFQQEPPHIAKNPRLREPQRQAHDAVRKHFRDSRQPAIIQIPVGCGKTGLMSMLPFGICQGRVLVVAPNVTIREAIFRDLDSASRHCFWRQYGVAPVSPLGPFAAKIDGPDATVTDCVESHFVVTNIQQLATAGNRWLRSLPPDFFDMVLIDEGHHNAAKSWQRVIGHFSGAKIVSLTATPFRADNKGLTGKIIYQYTFLRAMAHGYIKHLQAQHVAPCEIAFVFRDSPRRCSLAEILKLREEVWFSRGVALAPECNRHIVAASIDACEDRRRANGTKHQIIAAACSVEHSAQIAALYRQHGYVAEAIHSGLSKSVQQNVLKRLKRGQLDVIVQVQMLGEGFDHPLLSVAAIFRPFRSLPPYIQFVGRIMRVIRQGESRHADNRGTVISHVGLNTERHWDQFRELDTEDRDLWSGLIRGAENNDKTSPREARENMPREFTPEMLVEWERIADMQQSLYANEAVDQTPLPAANASLQIEGPLYAGPQQRRRETVSQLKTHVEQAVREIHYRLQLDPMGSSVGRQSRWMRHMNNWNAIRYLIYWKLNRLAGRKPKPNKLWSLEETEQAIAVMPDVVRALIEKLQQRQLQTRSSRKWPSRRWQRQVAS